MKRPTKLAAFLLPFALLLGACDGDTMSSGTGSLSLLLTDAPGDIEAAWVTIDRIYLQPGDEAESDGEGDMDGRGQGRVDLMTDDVTVDLLTLASDIEELVSDVPVPAGFYNQLRVIVTQACIAVEGDGDELRYYATSGFDATLVPLEDVDVAAPCATGAAGRLQTPSLAQTGIKVRLPGDGLEVTAGRHIVLLDFDVSESFGHQAGNSGMWVMHPVIKASEVGLSGSIAVNLSAADTVVFPEVAENDTLSLADFVADLSTEEADAIFTDEDGDGVYTATFPYLVPDAAVDFIVTIEAPEGLTGYTFTFDPASATLSLGSGTDLVVDFVLTRIVADAG